MKFRRSYVIVIAVLFCASLALTIVDYTTTGNNAQIEKMGVKVSLGPMDVVVLSVSARYKEMMLIVVMNVPGGRTAALTEQDLIDFVASVLSCSVIWRGKEYATAVDEVQRYGVGAPKPGPTSYFVYCNLIDVPVEADAVDVRISIDQAIFGLPSKSYGTTLEGFPCTDDRRYVPEQDTEDPSDGSPGE